MNNADHLAGAAAIMGRSKSPRKAESSRRNGLKGGKPRIYSPCPRYKNKVHRFSVHADGLDRCPCGYERATSA